MTNNDGLSVYLTHNSKYIKDHGPTPGELSINIHNIGADVACKRVRILIPYGNGPKALTNTVDHISTTTDPSWAGQSPEVEGGNIQIDISNDLHLITADQKIQFLISDIQINANSAGTPERPVMITIEFFARRHDHKPFATKPLTVALKSQPAKKVPFVNFFAPSSFQVKKEEVFTLQWNISNGTNPEIRPVFLGDKDHTEPDLQEYVVDDSSDVWKVDNQSPRQIGAVGTLQVKLIRSTAFVIYANPSDPDPATDQIEVFVQETGIISWSAPNLPAGQQPAYGQPLQLSWIIMFANPLEVKNEALLLITEKDNAGKPIPQDAEAPLKPPAGFTATYVIKLNHFNNQKVTTVYPYRPASYTLFLYDGKQKHSKSLDFNPIDADFPIGSISLFAGQEPSPYWKLCQGQKITRAAIPKSFDELAIALGQVNNSGELVLPNLMDRLPVGASPELTLRTNGGPNRHNHKISTFMVTADIKDSGNHYQSFPAGWTASTASNNPFYGPSYPHDKGPQAQGLRAAGTHNHSRGSIIFPQAPESLYYEGLNRPKFLALNFMIRVAVPYKP